MNHAAGSSSRLRRLGSAVADQALLSATNLAAGVALIRHASDKQYGYYVLATNAVLLMVTLQNGFFGAPMINRLTPLPPDEQGQLVAGLKREQGTVLLLGVAAFLGLAAVTFALGLISSEMLGVAAAFSVCALAMLHREFFRMVMLAHRHTGHLLRADLFFVVVFLGGVELALGTTRPGIGALLALCAAAAVAGFSLSVTARRGKLIVGAGQSGMLRQLAPVGAWAAAGGAIYWVYGQGYSYLVAGTLDVGAVAAVSATRLLMMPLNLVATGVSQLMLPTASGWLHREGAVKVMSRLLWIGGAMCLMAMLYFCVAWQLRGWIFGSLLHRTFANQDQLFCLWAGIFGLMVVRDQLQFLLVLRERFRTLAVLSLCSAGLAVALSYPAMLHLGAGGALVGMLAGEVLNIAGIAFLARREVRLGMSPCVEAI